MSHPSMPSRTLLLFAAALLAGGCVADGPEHYGHGHAYDGYDAGDRHLDSGPHSYGDGYAYGTYHHDHSFRYGPHYGPGFPVGGHRHRDHDRRHDRDRVGDDRHNVGRDDRAREVRRGGEVTDRSRAEARADRVSRGETPARVREDRPSRAIERRPVRDAGSALRGVERERPTRAGRADGVRRR